MQSDQSNAFFQKSVKFLGHVISDDGVSVDPEKIEVIRNWPVPWNASEVRSFLGLGNYFKRFAQGYSKLTSPLIDLTKPNRAFEWNAAAQSAFELMKMLLSSAPVLALADLTAPFEVICDASGYGCGAVLQQNKREVAFLQLYDESAREELLYWRAGAAGCSEGSASLAMLP